MRFSVIALCWLVLLLAGLAQAQLSGMQKLHASSKSPLISFKDSHFKKYIKTNDRPYGVYMIFEPDEDAGCPYCVELRKQLMIIATVYNSTRNSNSERFANEEPIFFVSAHPRHCREAFAQLNVQSLPLVSYFPTNQESGHITIQNFPIRAIEALTEPYILRDWIAETSGVQINIPLPLLRRPMVQYTALAVLILVLLRLLPVLLRSYNHPMVGFVLFMFVYVVVMNGTVWNAIHEPPFWAGRGHQLALFAPSMQSQFKAEGMLMALLFVVVMTLWVLLTSFAPRIHRPFVRLPMTVLLSFALLFFLNSIWRIFSHQKMGGGYPFYFDMPSLPFA